MSKYLTDTSQIAIIDFEDIIRGQNMNNLIVVSLRGTEHAWGNHLELKIEQSHVWKVSWELSLIPTREFQLMKNNCEGKNNTHGLPTNAHGSLFHI